MLGEIESQQNYLAQMEDKMYKANVTSLELLKQLKASEQENESLKLYIVDMKQKLAVYIAASDDAVDAALAEYINSYPDRRKLKVMFYRVEPGVYTFGTRKVGVKLELAKLKVRVGGGWISIDEFLDQYTAEELER